MSADAATLSSVGTAQVPARPGPSRGRRRATRTVGAVVLNVLLYVIAFMCTFPFLWMLATALKPEDNAVTNNFFFGYSLTWSNFKQAWDFFPFGQFMINSFIYSFGVTGVVLVASTTGGYAFARLKFPGREKLFSVYVATLLVPAAVTVIPLFLLATKLHIYNTYLGLIFPVSFSAFGTFFMRQFFRTLPEELRDSARMDGATEFWIFSRHHAPVGTGGGGRFGRVHLRSILGRFPMATNRYAEPQPVHAQPRPFGVPRRVRRLLELHDGWLRPDGAAGDHTGDHPAEVPGEGARILRVWRALGRGGRRQRCPGKV